MQIGLNLSLPGIRALDPAVSVRALFINNEPGVWFEANDANTLFTDVAGTTPVTAPGDAVALQLDKSQGLVYKRNLIPNAGNPFVSTDDWTITLAGTTASIVAGKFRIESGGTGGRVTTSITGLAVGETVFVTISDIASVVGSSRVRVTTNPDGTSGVIFTETPVDGDNSYSFIATQETMYLSVLNVTGTVGVTEFGGATVEAIPGNHRTQATTAARPLYALHPVGGVRNLLQYTEDGSNWTTLNLSQVTLDGEITLTENAESLVVHRAIIASDSVSNEANIIRFEVKPNGRTKLRVWVFAGLINVDIDVENQTLLDKHSSMGVPSFSTTPDGFTVVTFTGPSNRAFNALNFLLLDDAGNSSYTGDGTSGFIIRKPQLELGSTATNYQRVGSFLDVSEEGKARRGRLWYNGTSHFMETGTITPGTDKVQVFAGVRKLRNDAQEAVVELNDFGGGGLSVQTRATSEPWRFGSRGAGAPSVADAPSNTFTSPVSSIITGLGDISGDSAILRVDGVEIAESTADQGLVNYANSALRFGARAGTSLFYNGYEDTSIIRFGPNLDADTISKVESYVASRTPEPTL